jgi:predicted secreted protein
MNIDPPLPERCTLPELMWVYEYIILPFSIKTMWHRGELGKVVDGRVDSASARQIINDKLLKHFEQERSNK